MIKIFLIFIVLLTNFNNIVCDDLLVYDKIIKWYEKENNETWSGIYFNFNINLSTSINLINNIHNKILNGEKNIFIVLNTNGGDLIVTYEIINFMDLTREFFGTQYHCLSIKTHSSGFFIFQLCDNRYWIDNISKMMTHEPKLNIEGTFKFVKNYLDENFNSDYQKYNAILKRIYSKSNEKLSEEIYNKNILNKDWEIKSSFAVRYYNFADFYLSFV